MTNKGACVNDKDLISRAAAIEAFDDERVDRNYGDVSPESVIEIIESIPAVDAAPVVHGWWIKTMIPANTTGYGGVGQDKKKGWMCSECRCAFDVKLLWCKNFCPSCGATMDDVIMW